MPTELDQGKDWITRQLQELASELGVHVESVAWRRGAQGFVRKYHTLTVYCGRTEVSLDIPDRKLEDYRTPAAATHLRRELSKVVRRCQ